ncbi:unnamed protein product [Polarella glacialis]|uniref:Uncharacterized protein n=1 Tax=Polarella glacialis TaxID=89957 RepID=A0A813FPV5_POLGL|nr:unnamed protein product [Polarella glacialis]
MNLRCLMAIKHQDKSEESQKERYYTQRHTRARLSSNNFRNNGSFLPITVPRCLQQIQGLILSAIRTAQSNTSMAWLGGYAAASTMILVGCAVCSRFVDGSLKLNLLFALCHASQNPLDTG